MEYSKEDLMEAKKQIWGVGENMGVCHGDVSRDTPGRGGAAPQVRRRGGVRRGGVGRGDVGRGCRAPEPARLGGAVGF